VAIVDEVRCVVNGIAMSLDMSESIQAQMATGSYEPEESDWVRQHVGPGGVFVDVGANVGWFTTLALSLIGPTGAVISFEPSPIAFAILERSLRAARQTHAVMVNAAVGCEFGEITLYLPLSGPVHSPSAFESPGEFAGVTVPVVALDSFGPVSHLDSIDLIKIDVEGSEPNVVRGLAGLARSGRIRRVICKYNSWWLNANQDTTVADLEAQFAALGFVEEATTDWIRNRASDGTTYDLRSVLYRHTTAQALGKPIAAAPGAASVPISATPRHAVEGDVDMVVRNQFFPNPAYQGSIIEVGAARPDYLSISASFRRQGWNALAVEPNPVFAALHRAEGAEVVECACGATDQDDVPFFVVHTSGEYLGETVTNESFSSLGVRGKFAELIETVPSTSEEIRVKVRRLDTILAGRGMRPGDVDVLSIDVEGWELEVLSGLSDDVLGPKVMIVENVFDEKRYVDAICARGYTLWRRIAPNDIFVRNDLGLPAQKPPPLHSAFQFHQA
jgi:FkbM family methyltransferase